MSYSKRRTAIRFMHHQLPTGKMQFTAPYPCPYCTQIFDQSSEHDHFLLCKKPIQDKEKRIEKLEETMKKLHTPPSIITVILTNVSKYYKILPINNIEPLKQTLSEETNLCLQKQNVIGWKQLIRGRISKDFLKAVYKHYILKHLGRSYTGEIWARKVIKSLLDIHIAEWITYCEAIHTSSLGLKNQPQFIRL